MVLFPFALAAALVLQQLPNKDLPTKPAGDAVIARIDGQPISATDVEPYLWDWFAAQAAQDLVTYKLISGEAAKRNLTVTDDEVQKVVDPQILRIQESAPAGQDIDELLHERTMPRSRLYIRAKADLLLTKIAEADFKAADYVKTSTLAIKPKSDSSDDLQAALNKAREAYTRLQKGEAWSKVLPAFTSDPAILSGNGALDWTPIAAYPASTQTEIAQLKAGQYTKPVQTRNGIQIFRLDTLGSQATGAILSSLRERVLPSLRQTAYDRIAKQSKVERFPTVHG